MSFQATNWANGQKAGSPSAKCVLYVLADCANQDDIAWPSQELLAARTEQSVDSVQRRLRELKSRGLISWTRRPGRKSHIYRLHVSAKPTPQSAVSPPPDTANSDDDTATEPDLTPHSCGTEDIIEPSQEPSLSESETADMKVDDRLPVTAFVSKWPTGAADNLKRTGEAWQALDRAEQHAAIAGIDAFVNMLRSHKRTHTPAGWRYLEDGSWKQLRSSDIKASAGLRAVNCWSKEWWAVLLFKINRGDKRGANFMVRQASELSSKQFTQPIDCFPSADEIASLHPYPTDSEAFKTWRPWLASKGACFGDIPSRFWIFLPSEQPPIECCPQKESRTSAPL